MRKRRPRVTPARFATSTTCRCNCSMTSGPSAPRDLQNRLRVRHLAGIDARERAIHQIGADFLLQVVVAPVEQMLQDQHPDHDLRRRAGTAAATTLRPPRFERLRDDLNHGLVLEQRVDLAATSRATVCAHRATDTSNRLRSRCRRRTMHAPLMNVTRGQCSTSDRSSQSQNRTVWSRPAAGHRYQSATYAVISSPRSRLAGCVTAVRIDPAEIDFTRPGSTTTRRFSSRWQLGLLACAAHGHQRRRAPTPIRRASRCSAVRTATSTKGRSPSSACAATSTPAEMSRPRHPDAATERERLRRAHAHLARRPAST